MGSPPFVNSCAGTSEPLNELSLTHVAARAKTVPVTMACDLIKERAQMHDDSTGGHANMVEVAPTSDGFN